MPDFGLMGWRSPRPRSDVVGEEQLVFVAQALLPVRFGFTEYEYQSTNVLRKKRNE
jgi:hypothetical protein